MPEDDAVVKIISRLGIDWSQAIQSAEAFAVKLETVNKQLQALEARAKGITPPPVGADAKQQIAALEKAAAQTKAGKIAGEKISKDLRLELLKTEADLRRLLARAESIGVRIQLGPADLGQLKNMQAALAAGRDLTKNELSRLETIQKRVALGSQEVRSVENAIRLEQERIKLLGTATAFEDREGIAKARANQLTQLELAALREKLIRLDETITLRKLDERIVGATNVTLRERLMTMQKELETLIGQMEANKTLNAQEMQRLNLLKAQAVALRSDVGVATSQARMAAFAEKTAKEQERIAQKAAESAQKVSVLGSQFERRASWFLAGTVFFGSMAALRQAVSTITEVESGMTVIARVTEDATFNFQKVRDQLLRLGVEYGMTWEQVSDIMTRWVQAGYNISDSLELTRASLLALNTAELDANYATQGLIAIMAQWGLTADQLLPTIDKINKVADDFAVTSQDLVDGLNRSGGAARVLGLTLEQTIAILTVMREATGRTGKEIGNALNSILSFIQRPIAIKAFETEGIQIWADEAKTQFRNVIDIFKDVAARWPQMSEATQNMFVQAAEQAGLYSEEMADVVGLEKEFSDVQQRNISQAMAGIYRRNYLLALLQNWAKVDQVLVSMENSLGYSMRENERTMQTLQKRYEALKASAQELAVTLGEAGLLDELKSLADTGTNAIQWFNSLPPVLKDLTIQFVMLTMAIKVFDAVLKMAGAESIGKFALNLAGLSGLVKNVGAGLLGLFGGPWGLALTGTITGVSVLITELKKAKAQQEQNDQAAKALVESYFKQKEALDNASLSAEQYISANDQLNSTIKAIGEIMPEVVTAWNKHGEAIALAEDKLKSYTQTVQFSAQQMAYISLAAAELDRYMAEMAVRQAQTAYTATLHEMGKYLQQKAAEGTPLWAGSAYVEAQTDKAKGELEAAQRELKAAEAKVKITQQAVDEFSRKIKSAPGVPSVPGAADTSTAKTLLDQIRRFIDLATAHADAQALVNAAIQRAISLSEARIGYYQREGASIKDQIEALKEQAKQVDLLREKQASLSEEANRVRQAIAELEARQQTVNTSTDEGKQAYDELGQEIERLKDRLGNLSVEWWNLQKAQQVGLSDLEKIRAVRAANIDYIEAEIQYLTREGASIDELNQANQRRISLLALYAEKQRELNNRVTEQQSLLELARQAYANGEITLNQLNQVTADVAKTTADLGRQLLDVKGKMNDLQKAAYAQQAAFDSAKNAIERWARFGVLSVEQQIAALRHLSDYKTLTDAEEEWRQEQLFRNYQQLLDDQQKAIEEAYQERLRLIDEEANARIAVKQAELDALDVEDEQQNREEAERQHLQKLADLQEQRRYHELRTGKEHEKAIADIDKQIAEEERRWALQQAEWQREDKRRQLQKEIDDIRSAADEQRRQWEKAYKQMQADFSDHNKNLIALAATYDEQWLEKGKQQGELWLQGFKTGSAGFSGGNLGTVAGQAEQVAPVVTSQGQVIPRETLSAINEIVYSKQMWKQGFETGDQGLMDWAAENAKQYYEQLPAEIATMLQGMNYEQALQWYNSLPKGHTGAEVLTYGAAVLKPGELVFPPSLSVQLGRLISILERRPFGPAPVMVDSGRPVTFNGPLFHAERVELNDEQDMEIFSRELSRAAKLIIGGVSA